MKRTILVITTFVFIFSFALYGQQQTSDGGYIIAGSSDTYSTGSHDFILYKLAANGAKQWRKNFGGEDHDYATMVAQTSDGGYIVVGSSDSFGVGSPEYNNMLVYKLNAYGAKQWRKHYGGDYDEFAWGVIQTSDGGYLITGETYTYIHGPGINADFIAYKLDAAGNKQWRKNYGGDEYDYGMRAVEVSAGGYAIVGSTRSYTNGKSDMLIYRLDAAGTKLWRKNYGGQESDYGMFIRYTNDGGFVISGYTYSYVHLPLKMEKGFVPSDILVYKLNATGVKQWRKNYGGDDTDEGYDIRQTSDGGYVLCGDTNSYTHGDDDMLVYRVDASGAKLWRKNYGGEFEDKAIYVVPASDGGYLIFGNTSSYTNGQIDFLVYKVNAAGQKQWRKNYGGALDEEIMGWN